MTNFKVGDYVIATAAANKRYKFTTEGWIGVVTKKAKKVKGEIVVEVAGEVSPLPFMKGEEKFNVIPSVLKKIESPTEYFLKEGVTDEKGNLTEKGKDRLLESMFAAVNEGLYRSAMRERLEAKKAERDVKKIAKTVAKKVTKK
jgi:hypothetical protein